MAKVIVTLGHDWRKIAELAGGDPALIMFDPPSSELEVPDVTQGDLDNAFITYTGDQVNIDAATAAAKIVTLKDSAKNNFDTERVLKALAGLLVDEFNILRQQLNTTTSESPQLTNTNLSDRTFAQLRDAIRAKIDAGT